MEFLYNAPAILYKKALIVGDTHFGIERELRKKGIYDDFFSVRLAEKLKALAESTGAERLIFLGDVKEEIGTVSRETKEALKVLGGIKITVIKGNHDGGIEEVVEDVVDSKGMVFGELGLVHGHAWPKEEIFECRYIVSGHQHPTYEFTDAFGTKHSEPVWAFVPPSKKIAKKTQLILIPAFNPLVGYPLNNPTDEHLGPLLNNNLFKLKDAILFRLDGTPLGVLKELGNDGEKKAWKR